MNPQGKPRYPTRRQSQRSHRFIFDAGQMKKASLIGLALVVCGVAGVALRTKPDAMPPVSPGREQTKIQQAQPDEIAHPVDIAAEPVTTPEIVPPPPPPPPTETVVPPAWPQRVLMAGGWQNRGALSPSEALETLFWAKEGADVKTMVSLIDFSVFTESDLQEAANRFAAISQDRRSMLGIATVEEFIALAWSVSGKARFNGALFVKARSTNANAVELRVQLFGTTDALGTASFGGNHPFVFHRTLEGWRWRMQPHEIAAVKNTWERVVGPPPLARTSKSPIRR